MSLAIQKVKRPVLRWHGGKWKLAPWIISHFPKHKVYTEVYGGAGSVLLRKPRSYAEIWNDLDNDVVTLFRILRDEEKAKELKRVLELTPFARQEFMEAYEPCEDEIESVRRFIILSFMGFGSDAVKKIVHTGFRANSTRSGTIPAHDWANYPKCLEAFTARLKGVCVEKRPALQVISQHDGPETLHYLDPPYVHETRKRTGQHGYTHEMTDQQHVELSEVLHQVKGMVVLSGYRGTLYEDLYRGWETAEVSAHADGAGDRVEVLWFNEAAVIGKEQGKLL